eukprot:Rmarinus@m.13563
MKSFKSLPGKPAEFRRIHEHDDFYLPLSKRDQGPKVDTKSIKVPLKYPIEFLERWWRRSLYRNLIVYLAYLIGLVWSIVSIPMESLNSQALAIEDRTLGENFPFEESPFPLSFSDIYAIEEFWIFVNGPLMSFAFDDSDSFELVGGIELRQVRVRPFPIHDDLCMGEIDMEAEMGITHCFPEFSCDAEQTEAFVRNNNTYTYRDDLSYLDGKGWGVYCDWTMGLYGPGGFVVHLDPHNEDVARDQVSVLIEDEWFDAGTRAVAVTLNIWDPNSRAITVQRSIVEVLASGEYYASKRRATLYKGPISEDITVEEVFFSFATLVLSVMFINNVRRHVPVWSYLLDPWSWLELGQVFLMICLFIYYLKAEIDWVDFPGEALEPADEFQDMYEAVRLWRDMYLVVSWLILISFLRLFVFLQMTPSMLVVFLTLSRAMSDAISMVIIFTVLWFGFAVQGHLIYGAHIKDFSSFSYALQHLFLMMVGNFDYRELEEVNRQATPIFFYMWNIFVTIILLNLFIAIVSDGFTAIQQASRSSRSSVLGKLKGFSVFLVLFYRLKAILMQSDDDENDDFGEDESEEKKPQDQETAEWMMAKWHHHKAMVQQWELAATKAHERGWNLLAMCRKCRDEGGMKTLNCDYMTDHLGIDLKTASAIVEHYQYFEEAEKQILMRTAKTAQPSHRNADKDPPPPGVVTPRKRVLWDVYRRTLHRTEHLDALQKQVMGLLHADNLIRQSTHTPNIAKLSEVTADIPDKLKEALTPRSGVPTVSTSSWVGGRRKIILRKYVIEVITGDVLYARTTANVFVTLHGTRGQTPELSLSAKYRTDVFTLSIPADPFGGRRTDLAPVKQATKLFGRSQMDVFIFESRDIGEIREITLRHDNKGLLPSWFVHRVMARAKGDKDFVNFELRRWLATDEGDGAIAVTAAGQTKSSFT